VSEKPKATTGVVQRNAGVFQPGHLRVGGRKKRTAAQARALADELGVDPLSYLLTLLASEVMEEAEIGPNGKVKHVKVPVPTSLKVDISKSILGHFYPKLNATQVTGNDDGPIGLATLDLTPILSDAALAHAVQEAVIQGLEAEAAALDAESGPAPKLLEAHFTDDDSN
jgi:hypothetical protein